MKFELRAAETLTGPRVYSTDFHPRTLERNIDPLNISRSLKVKLLTKGVVTVNGGHLLNPVAFEIVKQNPSLLSDGLLLPAIREDKGNFDSYVADNLVSHRAAGWSDAQVADAVAFLQESVRVVLPWKVEQAQERYRDRLIWGLTSDRSLSRQRLLQVAGCTVESLSRLAEGVAAADLREDSMIDRLIAPEPEQARRIISRLSEAAYHLVGTSVVNCETGLDVSELADRRFADLSGSEVYADVALLTDANVFMRCCFETAMQAINESAFPAGVLDAMPYDVIGKIRVRLQEQGFQQAYDEVIASFTSRLSETRIEDLESWEPGRTVDLVDGLARHFRAYFDEELRAYRKAIQESAQQKAIRSGMATAKSAGGAIPGISELMSIVDIVGTGTEALRAAGDAFAFLDHGAADEAARRQRDDRLDEALKRLSPQNEAKILTGLRQLRTIAADWQRPF